MRSTPIGLVATVLALCCTSVTGCAYYPKVVDDYDVECRTMQKRLVVEKSAYGMQRHCTNEACIAELAAIPIEAIVAGSVVVVGNTILWLQNVGNCR